MHLLKHLSFNLKYGIFQIVIISLIIAIIINPTLAINSAKEGSYIWFNILLPSLLPFFILAELFILSGFVDFFGKLLQPIMIPLFNVPGTGAFPLIMSIVSGYPVGAKLSSRLRQEEILSKTQGNRLITFTSTSGPIFILGAVLIGMLNAPDLSLLLILPHYLGIITLGLIFRFYKSNSKDDHIIKNNSNIIKQEKGKSIGQLIYTSIMQSINSILLIGGFVIIYNVIIELLLGSKYVNYIIISLSKLININPEIIKGIFAGLIELTTGCQKISTLNIDLIYKILIINFLIAWGGLSILSQAISFIGQTDLNTSLYLFSKFLHGILSCIYTYILYLLKYKKNIMPSSTETIIISKYYNINYWLYSFFDSTKLAIGICIYFIIISLLIHELWNKKEA